MEHIWAYLAVSMLLFVIGCIGVLVQRNAIVIFMSIELMLNAANLAFLAFARQLGTMEGQVLAMFVIALAAAEVAIGLGIIVAVFRSLGTAHVDELRELSG